MIKRVIAVLMIIVLIVLEGCSVAKTPAIIYNGGDVVDGPFRFVGRVTNDGTRLYGYVGLDKTINAETFDIELTSGNVYVDDQGQSLVVDSEIQHKEISKNMLIFSIKLSKSCKQGALGYAELKGTVTFK